MILKSVWSLDSWDCAF